MKLAQAAAYFDQTPCADAYAPSSVIYGQLDLFDDSRRDGATVARRILSVAPGVTLPVRHALTIHGDQWIVGTYEVDSFKGEVIRRKYVLHRAEGLCTVQTPGQVLDVVAGSSAYAARLWIKDSKELGVSSELESFLNFYFGVNEGVSESYVLTLGGRLHWVRNVMKSAAGFLVAEVSELPADALGTGTLTHRTYDPATDTRVDGAGVSVSVLRLRYQDDYAYESQSAEQFEAGDVKAFVTASLASAPQPNDTLALTDGVFRVVEVTVENGAYGLHLRKAGT